MMTKILIYWNLAREGLPGLVTSWGPIIVSGVTVERKIKHHDFKNSKRKNVNTNK